MKHWVYLDYAATTPVSPEVKEAMLPYFDDLFGNPSGFSGFSDGAREAISQSRDTVADFLGADPGEIYFTSGGTESDNWALKAAAYANRDKGKHIITSRIEHHAVLRTCQWLEKAGFEVTYLDVDEKGLLDPEDIKAAIRPDTILISVMTANNEIGTIQPVKEIGAIAREHHIYFHTDAVQAYGNVPIDVDACGIDLLSASGHKFSGPKGVGILYIRKGTKIGPLLHGGAQEQDLRAGTYNTPGIVGFGAATKLAADHREQRAEYEIKLRDHLIHRVLDEIPCCRLNGDWAKRLPGNVNISIQGVKGESVLILLDRQGICASSGSACTAGSLDPSHVLLAIGLSDAAARASLRMTLSAETTVEEVDYAVDELKKIVSHLRGQAGRRRTP